MAITTVSSHQFSQAASNAKKAAEAGPVFIMDRGRTTHVLLTFDAYKKMSGSRSKIADLLAMPGIERLEIDVPQLRDPAQPAKLY